jgi:hypothetical protein
MKKVLFILLLVGMVFSLSYAGSSSPPVKQKADIVKVNLQDIDVQVDMQYADFEFTNHLFVNENALIRAGQFTKNDGFEFAALNRNFYNRYADYRWKLIIIPNCNRLIINRKFLYRQILRLNNSDYSQLGYSMRE